MLRVKDPDSILNPEGYLFTVAGNLLKENAAVDSRQARAVDVEGGGQKHRPHPRCEDSRSRRWMACDGLERLCVVLKELSPKCCAAVILQYVVMD